MNRTMPNQEQRPRSGTKMQQKPMPKQDKGGGINLTAEGALRCSLPTRGKPALGNRNPKRDMDRNLTRPIAITL